MKAQDKVILSDEYLCNAQKKDIDYLLMLRSDKFLYEFCKVSGLESEAECGYGGWERSDGVNFRGHFFGHYMTALSQAYLCEGEEERRQMIFSRIQDAVYGLRRCQKAYAAKHPESAGYVSPFRECALDKLEGSPDADENVLVPWYILHKVLMGLLKITVNLEQEKEISQTALEIAKGLGDYIYLRTSKWSEVVQKKVLQVEYGGMNEALYLLYELTGEEKHRKAAHSFDETELFEQILEQGDILEGKHANTMIPKMIGAVRRWMVLREKGSEECAEQEREETERYLDAAGKFWDIVTASHTYITGGNSYSEHFNRPDTLAAHLGNRNCETCNAHNMLRLSRMLFDITEDKKYMDFCERLFLNSILPAQNPESGMMTYFQPMEAGFYKLFNRPFDHFWCCTGTGIENYTRMGENIFWYRKNVLYINLYLSAVYKGHGMEVEVRAGLPEEETVSILIRKNTDARPVNIRIPDWTEGEYDILVNGDRTDRIMKNGYYVYSNGKAGDRIHLTFRQRIKCHRLKDTPCVMGFSYGAYVLACGLGTDDLDREENTGILVKVPWRNHRKDYTVNIKGKSTEEWSRNPESNFVRMQEPQLAFHLRGTEGDSLTFRPYFRLYRERYGIYLHFADAEEQKRIKTQKELIVDEIPFFDANNMEYGHNLVFEGGETGVFRGRSCRRSAKWFSYDMEIAEGNGGQMLCVAFHSRDGGNRARIIFNEEREVICHIPREAQRDKDGCCLVALEIPPEYLAGPGRRNGRCEAQRGKHIISVRFEPMDEKEVRIFGLSVQRQEATGRMGSE